MGTRLGTSLILGTPRLLCGRRQRFDDLVNFWNLRAADIELIFHDQSHAVRLDALKTAHLEVLAKRPASAAGWPDQISIWGKSRDGYNPRDFAPNAVGCTATTTIWNGLNVLPPVMYSASIRPFPSNCRRSLFLPTRSSIIKKRWSLSTRSLT